MTTKATSLNDTTAYAAIVKFEEQADGTVLAYGKATDDTLDSDEQICDPQWLKEAMPEWFKYGNIREQHSSIAAGVATEYEHKEDGHYITAHVVDLSSAKKVKSGVLKGFSIGIRRPRVVKDNKAAGGRIIDGQIVEISLVDRPANPSCVLTVAKTVNSELVQVEELNETEGVKMFKETVNVLAELVKGLDGDVTKFDQTTFDAARTAIAQLIQIEAGEMAAEGSDESYSLTQLLMVVHYLFEWYEGEMAEGEATGEMQEGIEMADNPDVEMCDKCNKSMNDCKCMGKSDMEMCAKCDKALDECKCGDKSDTVKCLECGCNQPSESHGRDDVSTAVIYSPKSVASDEVTGEKALSVSDIRDLVADAVKALLPTQVGEDAVTKSQEAERIEALESELEQVKALAVPSGPKRFGAVGSTTKVDAKKAQAELYRQKANLTLDKSLATGYLSLAKEIEDSNS
jgi:hypothetical protein